MRFLIATLLLAFSLAADEPIVVRLATNGRVMPLYLTKVFKDNPGFDDSYLQNLRRILAFDLSFNGMTEVVQPVAEIDGELAKLPFADFGDQAKWKANGLYYVVKVRASNHGFDVRVMSVNGGMVRGVDHFPLTGDFSHDRKQVHRLADAVYRVFFDDKGIAASRILFTRRMKHPTEKEWNSEVWEMDYDGGNVQQVTKGSGYAVTPVYIPQANGGRPTAFYYVAYKTGQPKIYWASLRDGMSRRLTTLQGNQLLPAISRQGDKVAFIGDYTGNPDIFLQRVKANGSADDKPVQIYAHIRATQGSPTFSPDGSKLAFVSNQDGSPKIYVMTIPKAGERISRLAPKLLTRFQSDCTGPCWSADGTKLAYSALTRGVRQIWVYDLNRDKEEMVTDGVQHKENPSWAPNNLHLTYNTVTPTESEVYIININQRKPVKISSGPGEKRFPNWEPF